ncbi:MAG: HD domain-containing protein [Methanobacteriota archaeon]
MIPDQIGTISGSDNLTPGDEPVLDLMNRFDPDPRHAVQVMRLSVRLFDDLIALHGFGSTERRILCIAALLHDIGWSVPAFPHHKASMRLILTDETISLTTEYRCVAALIARYHRKSHPSLNHSSFASLSPAQQNIVRWNAALLRVADALDRSHRSLVRTISARFTETDILIWCGTGDGRELPSDIEEAVLLKKTALLNEISGRRIEVQWN